MWKKWRRQKNERKSRRGGVDNSPFFDSLLASFIQVINNSTRQKGEEKAIVEKFLCDFAILSQYLYVWIVTYWYFNNLFSICGFITSP